ncbi:RNA polymerase sigma factor [Sphingobacterium sp. SGL-16]|uniref:Sigma-70 family RNA polymerase sigma factor n=2 Tax=Sphingobacterium litopenaei TaxID=2763500 RepID=A0ABR7YEL9_9SPHI|nr:sigma-70 family RNA polymerase sigma factor [Sphingobacterium sp. SGL-16]MBD1429725.1 sigma-70 family RNA polymerase sigma factor [Sphingobacterium litopenaei]NGM74427.1 sigma-70 family RNA polymerase sigma factor [Sphingobacterium sp. SGL-16]
MPIMKLNGSSLSKESDESLLEKYTSSEDLNVLGELYTRHSEMVYYVCLRYFKDEEKSKDAVMQLFEQLIVKIKKQTIQDFPKWLYVVAKNFCLMELRSSKKIEISTDEFVEFPTNLHPQEDYAEKEERLSQLEKCIQKLPEKQRISIDLFFINQKCYKEVVEITGFSMNDVKSYIQNGKRNLKNCMEKSDEQI